MLRVRTIRPRPGSERGSAEAIEEIKATFNHPNPKDQAQSEPQPERKTEGVEHGSSGVGLPEAPTQQRETHKRDFRIGNRIIDKFGHTPGCQGCDAKKRGQPPQGHTRKCRKRFEEAMVGGSAIPKVSCIRTHNVKACFLFSEQWITSCLPTNGASYDSRSAPA